MRESVVGNIYDAIIRSKLVQGPATAALTQSQLDGLDAFQMWAIR